jgi:hypothetical protein
MILCARTQGAAFYSGHSGQSPLVLNHIEPHYKDKVGSIPRGRLAASDLRVWHRSWTDYGPCGSDPRGPITPPADVCTQLAFGSHIRIPSQLTTDECQKAGPPAIEEAPILSRSRVQDRTTSQRSSTIQAGAWSLAFSSPRTHRSTPPCTSRSHTVGERRK